MKKVLILGGLGNGTVIAHAIVDANNRGHKDIICSGFVNDQNDITEIEGFPVLGGLNDIQKLLCDGYFFINTIFKIGGQKERILIFQNSQIPEERLATFIHPMAYVAPTVTLGHGCVIMPNASISSGTHLGKGCRVMVGSTIGHNNIIGDYCFFAANSCTGAFLRFGDAVTVSLNSCVKENLKIGNYATIGMGAVVLKDIKEGEIWVGNPAKYLRTAE
ncbi:MAG: sugar O-acyltransferase [Bacteroidetes bacterium]|nr:sugar O-acyltransferase [Bacteroidota bacterium]